MRQKNTTPQKTEGQCPAWLGLAAVLILMAAMVLSLVGRLLPARAQPKAAADANVWLPSLSSTEMGCDGNLLANGDFEEGSTGWHTSTYPSWRRHDLIGPEAQGFHPFRGAWSARLGGVEGASDVMTQTVALPQAGQLSYWWWMHSYDTLPIDSFRVGLSSLDGSLIAWLRGHGIEEPPDVWQQDTIDVSAYAGQALMLSLSGYNDNYYFSWWDLDGVCLRPAP